MPVPGPLGRCCRRITLGTFAQSALFIAVRRKICLRAGRSAAREAAVALGALGGERLGPASPLNWGAFGGRRPVANCHPLLVVC